MHYGGGRSGGIRNLLVGSETYSTQHTIHSKDNEATFHANIIVKYSKADKKKKYFAYAVYGMDIPIKNTFNEYRKRFGIKSSNKLMNTSRAGTTSKKPALILLYMGFKIPLNQQLDQHTMDIFIHQKTRRTKTHTMVVQNNAKTNHQKY